MIAALFVERPGPYTRVPGVDAWCAERDARGYRGPWPVVAHPPCKRWGRYWSGGPSVRVRRHLGDDSECFLHALAAVRQFGGVLEHPEASHAFRVFKLGRPRRGAGWQKSPAGGWACCVEQGHYGHAARKATWLYVFGVPSDRLPALEWGTASGKARMEPGFHSREERAAAPEERRKIRRLTRRQRIETPDAFRDILLGIAKEAA